MGTVLVGLAGLYTATGADRTDETILAVCILLTLTLRRRLTGAGLGVAALAGVAVGVFGAADRWGGRCAVVLGAAADSEDLDGRRLHVGRVSKAALEIKLQRAADEVDGLQCPLSKRGPGLHLQLRDALGGHISTLAQSLIDVQTGPVGGDLDDRLSKREAAGHLTGALIQDSWAHEHARALIVDEHRVEREIRGAELRVGQIDALSQGEVSAVVDAELSGGGDIDIDTIQRFTDRHMQIPGAVGGLYHALDRRADDLSGVDVDGIDRQHLGHDDVEPIAAPIEGDLGERVGSRLEADVDGADPSIGSGVIGGHQTGVVREEVEALVLSIEQHARGPGLGGEHCDVVVVGAVVEHRAAAQPIAGIEPSAIGSKCYLLGGGRDVHREVERTVGQLIELDVSRAGVGRRQEVEGVDELDRRALMAGQKTPELCTRDGIATLNDPEGPAFAGEIAHVGRIAGAHVDAVGPTVGRPGMQIGAHSGHSTGGLLDDGQGLDVAGHIDAPVLSTGEARLSHMNGRECVGVEHIESVQIEHLDHRGGSGPSDGIEPALIRVDLEGDAPGSIHGVTLNLVELTVEHNDLLGESHQHPVGACIDHHASRVLEGLTGAGLARVQVDPEKPGGLDDEHIEPARDGIDLEELGVVSDEVQLEGARDLSGGDVDLGDVGGERAAGIDQAATLVDGEPRQLENVGMLGTVGQAVEIDGVQRDHIPLEHHGIGIRRGLRHRRDPQHGDPRRLDIQRQRQ